MSQISVRVVTKQDEWDNCRVRQVILADQEPTIATHGPTGLPVQFVVGDREQVLELPEGSEVYETVYGETCVRVPQAGFQGGMCLTLAEAVKMYGS